MTTQREKSRESLRKKQKERWAMTKIHKDTEQGMRETTVVQLE